MLKFIFTFISILFVSTCFSQINRGSFLMGTDIYFQKTKYTFQSNESTNKMVGISPSFSTAIKQNLLAGIDLMYIGSEYENGSSNYINERKDMGAGLFIRPYKPVAQSFLVFLQGRAGYLNLDREETNFAVPNSRNVTEGSNVSLSFMPGVSYKAGKSVLFELGIRNLLEIEIESMKTTTPSPFGAPQISEVNNFGVSAAGDVQLNLGVRFIF